MALTNFSQGGLYFPPLYVNTSATAGFALNTQSISGNNEKVAFVFQIPQTGTINKLGICITGQGVAGPYSLSLQTVDASFNPTGVNYGGSSTINFFSAVVYQILSLGTGATAVAGDTVALVMTQTTATGNISIAVSESAFPNEGGGSGSNVQVRHFTSAAGWVGINQTAAKNSNFVLGYSDGSYPFIYGNHPWQNSPAPTLSFSTTTNPVEVALRFSFPAPVRIAGIAAAVSMDNINSNISAVFYNSDGTCNTIFPNIVKGQNWLYPSVTGGSAAWETMNVKFSTPITVAANTTYRMSLLPGTTDSMIIGYPTYANGSAVGHEFGGSSFLASTKSANGASWIDWTTTRPLYSLIIDQIDNGAGSGTTPTAVGTGGIG